MYIDVKLEEKKVCTVPTLFCLSLLSVRSLVTGLLTASTICPFLMPSTLVAILATPIFRAYDLQYQKRSSALRARYACGR